MYNFGEPIGNPTTYTYGYSTGEWGDRLVSFDGGTITYDAVGNPLSYYNGAIFGWTGRMLTSATKDGEDYTFTYDDGGIRQSKTKDGKKTTYYYDGGKLIVECNNDAAVIYTYDEVGRPLGCRVIVFDESGTADEPYEIYNYWYVCNLQGDVVKMLSEDGTTAATFTYDPYGKIASKSYNPSDAEAAHSNLFYRGYYYDRDLELYYLNSRYYDPNTGRFINPDKFVSTGQDFIGYNMYAYCGNNPVGRIDRLGFLWSPIENALSDVFGWLDKYALNDDGTYSLYDNDRFRDEDAWHEQIFAVSGSKPEFNLAEGDIGLGGVAIDLYTGGWEGDYVDVSLFDFGHAEASAKFSDGKINVGASASLWSPSVSFTLFGVEFEIGAEVVTAGVGFNANSGGFSLNCGLMFGFCFGVNW